MNLDKTSVTYAHAKLKIDDYWNRGITGRGVKVAIFDDGMGTHDALPISGGYACGKHSTYLQENRHATHCAGIAVGRNLVNGEPAGIAPDAELYSIRMYYKTYADRVKSFIEAIDYAIDEGIDIISMSVHLAENSINSDDGKGSSLGVPKHLRIPVRNAFYRAYKNNIIIVAAAGNHNDGTGKDNIEFEEFLPKMPNVITVANLTMGDKRRKTSGVGTWVDIAGYGTSIMSTVPGNEYSTMTGTSMSTPQIAGVFALYKQLFNSIRELENFFISSYQTIEAFRELQVTEIIEKVLSYCVKVEELTDIQQGAGVPQPPQELYALEVLSNAKDNLRIRNSTVWRAIDSSYYRDNGEWKEMEAMDVGE